ncbi:glycosyltransferase [Leptolyngbya sp. FACHB-17]|uniref:glycosyltransferase n=1 Tax=unclassified Leptolyngbya TaxID=2650499 RepID=UPI0016804101|nr:glycosyltransferase [Leptolyngbya sp. FACHB-17]MBD2081312.1 glycosyltransferase [Leptolyngbya sp. FACHB-17]
MTIPRLRVLLLASYFPRPDNPLMGTWALSQAEALARQNIELFVVSPTSWLPSAIALTPGAKAYANCPDTFTWSNSVRVSYPRWLYYPVPPFKAWAHRNPEPYLQLAWKSIQQNLCRLVQDFQPDVMLCHQTLPNGWIAAQLPEAIRPPIVTFDQDFDEVRDAGLHPHRKAAMQTVVNCASLLLAASKPMQQDLRRLFPKSRVCINYNGVNLPSEQALNTPRPISLQGKKVILACALFAERKGVPLLIEAFCRIAGKHPDAVLRIIGSGPDAEKVQQAADRYDVTAQVQLVGRKPHVEVLQEMVWADCFALVGWDEPFATVYLEAMAVGKPIICCNDGGINDVITQEVHGYSVPPKNIDETVIALDRMLSEDDKRLKMGQQAQHLIQHHLTWNVKAAELVQILEQVIPQRPQPTLAQIPA